MTMQALVKCPECGSINIDFSMHPELKCRNCGFKFKENSKG